ncbi:MAG: hypothetical protein E3J71_05375 [Candidatus Stahlbacteria bacterium]|nr:MAG: hypothetical protein E3J71_05375 [Candidatus Stahlbacteria bacterium]
MKVLIAYTTRRGSTREVAEKIGEILKSKGMEVNVSNVAEVSDISSYNAAVIGAPVMRFRFLPPAKKFVKSNKEALSKIPVAYFSLGITMKEDTPKRRERMMKKLKVVTRQVEPVDVGLFGGKYQGRDYRDWDKITAWAEGLAEKIK